MAAEYAAVAQQTVNPGETVVFNVATVPCERGFVRWRPGAGNFLLAGWVPNRKTCPCKRAKSAYYSVSCGLNIAVPTGETVGAISVAVTVDGAVDQSTTMIVTPAAVEEFFNVKRDTTVAVWRGCCENVAIQNTSTIPILVQNANIKFDRPDLAVTY